jgi:hypothetical protein
MILNMSRDSISVLTLSDSSSSMTHKIYSNESYSVLKIHEIGNNEIYVCASLTNNCPVYLGFYSFRK